MQRRMETDRTMTRTAALSALTVLVAALSLAACGVSISPATPSPQAGGTTQAGPAPSSPGGAGTAGATGTAGAPGGTGAAGPTSNPSASPSAEPTAAQWKTYTDPGRNVSFELPADWITQLVTGKDAKGVRVEVRDTSGDVVATLQTQITGLGGACTPNSMRPYTVISSIPMQIPSNNQGAAAVDPRFVYRVIQGATHFYASYGITDQSAGKDGRACMVYNTVQSKQLGIYMFGDVLQFTSAPDGSAGLRAFATLANAQAYMNTSEYLNVQRMVTSLKSLG